MPRLSANKPTDKQLYRIRQIINDIGEEKVLGYLHRFAHDSDLGTMTKNQAQRLIISLENLMPRWLVLSKRKRSLSFSVPWNR